MSTKVHNPRSDVVGLTGTFTDNRVLRADGTENAQDSGVSIDDSDNMTGVTTLDIDGTSTTCLDVGTSTRFLRFDSTNGRVGFNLAPQVGRSFTLAHGNNGVDNTEGAFLQYGNNSIQAGFSFQKTRNTSAAAGTAIQNGDKIGKLATEGDDGTRFWTGGTITILASGTIGDRRIPTAVTLTTTPDAFNGSGSDNEVCRATPGQRWGVGTTSPDTKTHTELSDSATSTVSNVERLTHITTGTAAAGYGLGRQVELESGGGVNRIASVEEVVWVTATNGSEDAKKVWKLMIGGAAAATVMELNQKKELHVQDRDVLRYSYLTS